MIRLGLITPTYEEFLEVVRTLEGKGFSLPSGTFTDGELELYHNLECSKTAVFFCEANNKMWIGAKEDISRLAMEISMENFRKRV